VIDTRPPTRILIFIRRNCAVVRPSRSHRLRANSASPSWSIGSESHPRSAGHCNAKRNRQPLRSCAVGRRDIGEVLPPIFVDDAATSLAPPGSPVPHERARRRQLAPILDPLVPSMDVGSPRGHQHERNETRPFARVDVPRRPPDRCESSAHDEKIVPAGRSVTRSEPGVGTLTQRGRDPHAPGARRRDPQACGSDGVRRPTSSWSRAARRR
jgi:hypothetical protein